MKLSLTLTVLLLMTTTCNSPNDPNKTEDRVHIALEEKGSIVEENLHKHHLQKNDLNILLVAYKDSDSLLLYAKSSSETQYKLIQKYIICARSGKLGPKKAEGDKQVPEGFYHINRFNPKSNYYLSLGLNYPNEYDQSKGYTGSDIFIHGKCETVGCLPMTDDYMKEIYLYALWAKESGQQQIPVYIFPFEMTDENMEEYFSQVDEQTISFWRNIQKGYQMFEQSKTALQIELIDTTYHFTF